MSEMCLAPWTAWYIHFAQHNTTQHLPMDVGDATSTTSMDVVKVGLEKQVGLELEGIQG